MEKEGTISSLMEKDHGLIDELLSTFRMRLDRLNYEEKTMESFKRFKDKEEGHVLVEENLIFKLKLKINKTQLVAVLKKQHKEMKERIEAIEKDISEKRDPTKSTISFQDLIQTHIKLEEENFYPVLDQELKGKEKQELIATLRKALRIPSEDD